MKKYLVLLVVCMCVVTFLSIPTQAYAAEESIESELSLAGAGKDLLDGVTDSNILSKLNSAYPDYTWSQSYGLSSKYVPIEMKSTDFPQSDIEKAIEVSGVDSKYGGCGPIAMMGIFDYFARYLECSTIMNNPENSSDRVILATQVLEEVTTYEVGWQGDRQTLTFPWDYCSGFNKLMQDFDLPITASYVVSGIAGGHKDEYLSIVKDYLAKGFPVTMFVGINSYSGVFSEHYVNVFAYEYWTGINNNGDIIEKCFFKTRLNLGTSAVFYADSEILDYALCGIIYYDFDGGKGQVFTASDFSNLINESTGNGQYFFYEKSAPVTNSNNFTVNTVRLRCSYIENQYLVLSANRLNAGEAYLEFDVGNDIHMLTFDMCLWSSSEGLIGEYVGVEYYDSSKNEWIVIKEINPIYLSTFKPLMNNFVLGFPRNVSRFRFRVLKSNPTVSQNKGRVVLDNITIYC